MLAFQEAPLEVQKKANCIIGKDYPNPIVDHKEISKTNIGRMKEAYDLNRKGDTSSAAKVESIGSFEDKPSPKKQKT